MIHAVITIIIAFLVLVFDGNYAFCFFPVFFYMGREHAQAEYRYIESHKIHRADCPLFFGLYPSAWTAKGLLDFLLPLAGAVLLVLLGGLK